MFNMHNFQNRWWMRGFNDYITVLEYIICGLFLSLFQVGNSIFRLKHVNWKKQNKSPKGKCVCLMNKF